MPEVEDKVWPFVISVLPPEPDHAFFGRYFEKQKELLQRREPWVHLVDIRLVVKFPDARVRNLVAERTKELEPLSAKYNLGTATVIKNSIARGILTAIHWIMPPPHPFLNVATPQEGVEYLRGCLQKADIPVPSRMSADLVELVAGRLSPQPVRSVL